jgi:hypothetical protein
MNTHFSPTQEDVARYLRLRAATDKLGVEIVRHVPEKADLEIAEALGLLHDGVVVLESQDISKIMADCCLHDWYGADGKTVIERYAETHPAPPGTEQYYVLNSLLHAQYRVLKATSLVPGAGAHCEDLILDEDLFVMDIGMSRNPVAGFVLATRTIPLGEYWMTGGTALPITTPEILKNVQRQFMEWAGPDVHLSPDGLSLAIVRACLDAGAADRVRYEMVGPKRKEPRHITRRNRHRL